MAPSSDKKNNRTRKLPLPWREGMKGRGKIYVHPHPNPLPSREREKTLRSLD